MEAQIRDAVEKYKKKEEDLQVTDMMCCCIYLDLPGLFSRMHVSFSRHLARNSSE